MKRNWESDSQTTQFNGTSGHRTRTKGVIFTPGELDFEGVDIVLDRMVEIGANAVAVTPGVFLPGTPETGVREPPLDVGGQVRQLDRPLWGSRVAYVQRYAPYAPNPELWKNIPFRAPTPAPDGYDHDVTRQMIDGARSRGLEPSIILSPTILPGLPGGHSMTGGTSIGDADERPLPVNGERSNRIIAGQGCPNNPDVRKLVLAYVQEAIDHYGDAAAFFFDWLEYTCYFLEDVFTCVCPACQRCAIDSGLEWEAMTSALRRFYDRLHQLTDHDLAAILESGSTAVLLDETDQTRLAQFWEYKSNSIADLLQLIKSTVLASGMPGLQIAENGFPPPFSTATGSKFAASAPIVDQVHAKFFTFHWAMMVRWYGETLREWNPGLDEALLVQMILSVFDIHPPRANLERLSQFGMPKPDERHPVSAQDIHRKVDQVSAAVNEQARVEATIHGYQPAASFAELVGEMERTDFDGIWVQRYGYLSDEKLDILKSHWTS